MAEKKDNKSQKKTPWYMKEDTADLLQGMHEVRRMKENRSKPTSKMEASYRTDPPKGQAGIPSIPNFEDFGDNIIEQDKKDLMLWMQSTMKDLNISANKWASLAKTSPTNITRFLKNGEFIPSYKTISKLSSVGGVVPYKGNVSVSNNQSINSIDSNGNKLQESLSLDFINSKTIPIKMLDNFTGYDLAGISSGDTVIVEQQSKYNDGDIIALRHTSSSFKDKILIGQIVGKHISFKSNKYGNPILFSECEVVGKVLKSIKDFS